MQLSLKHQFSFLFIQEHQKSNIRFLPFSLHSRIVSSTVVHLVAELTPFPASLWILRSISSTSIFLDTNSWSCCFVIINLILFEHLFTIHAPWIRKIITRKSSLIISSTIIGLPCSKASPRFFTMRKSRNLLVSLFGNLIKYLIWFYIRVYLVFCTLGFLRFRPL